MYSFNNDYSEGAHPRILQAMMEANLEQNPGYGTDSHSAHARELIRREIRREDADVHFIPGGTQTNLLAVSGALRPHQAVICAETGHINVHETGAIEATGHKVLSCPTPDGILTPEQLQRVLAHHTDEHMVQPKMVYISDATEVGTIYTKAALEELSRFCRLHGLYLFLDGARLGSALASRANDLTLADIAELTDLFYIGGTKNGALFGEALVLLHPDLKQDFRFLIKQRGAMMAKGWLTGIQFEELFQNSLFLDMASHANEMADLLRRALSDRGIPLRWESPANQIFPVLPDETAAALAEDFLFSVQEKPDQSHTCIRLVTSWATKPEGVEAFAAALRRLA
ncbi:MAG: aminotransferase class I/II-fold pyridoxal phosphate-dependent enzyme [Eubacteriales bacterium]|nr:aminotransferase class I/II-fold pyridoxal phosphate-dependent enzyme [Eubacteriales bacterium]